MPVALVLLALATGPASAADRFAGRAFYYGDPHAHTGLSHDGWSSDVGDGCAEAGGCGPFGGVLATARRDGLDWVVLSDHVNGVYATSRDEWRILLAKDLSREEPDVLAVPGAEVWFTTAESRLGHKNLLLFGDPAAVAGITRDDLQPGDATGQVATCEDIGAWMDGLTARFGPALLVPHHPMVQDPMPTDWSCHTDGYEPAVEMFSSWGTALGWDFDFDTPATIDPDGAVSVALDPDGYALRLGFLGGTDGHDTLPGDLCTTFGGGRVSSGGLTIAVVDEVSPFDRASLFRAIVHRHTIATSGPRVPLVLTMSDPHGDVWSYGDDVALPAGLPLDLRLAVAPAGVAAVDSAWLVTPDGEIPFSPGDEHDWTLQLPAGTAPAWGYVAVRFDGSTLGLCDDGDGTDEEWEWISPAWFTTVDHDWDGDGISQIEGDCDDEDATVRTCDTGSETGSDDTGTSETGSDAETGTGGEETGEPAARDTASVTTTPPADTPCGCASGAGTSAGLALVVLAMVRRNRR